ncbi:protein of unknown function [Actinokineospora alba]|uniref:DUF4291 domain-containing protein n=1 Tax=Actinokineospora alba TaxID=504798 RepID=A0A1H0S4D0_9PSEU|nr:DUF4291 domain-containing protein [Actinokineospora alba]TDP66773.1 uncharacterized protein DUF4291 [Actinokineospora alba]SDI50017.1 protein of unknown function [Actinokineospora alba]SDP36527.1 protein of unknown function [Actinokineospora alba]
MEKHEIRAKFDADTITVYQAYSPAIADAALAAGTFVPPFKRERMTWIKPSFLWMMYRCGWATKPDQERVLAIRITREGFQWALDHSCPSSPGRMDAKEWRGLLKSSPVRVQWDPERDLHHRPLAHRSIQIGLSGPAAHLFVDDWLVDLADATPSTHKIGALVREGDLDSARGLLPAERPYPG